MSELTGQLTTLLFVLTGKVASVNNVGKANRIVITSNLHNI